MPDKPPLDDLLGKKVVVDGHEWTVKYSEVTKRLVLERPLEAGLEILLQAMRQGAVSLDTDPAQLLAGPLPTDREIAAREWMIFDAMIAGARLHGTLAPETIELFERRLEQLTGFLCQ